jgi:hypothetical protein
MVGLDTIGNEGYGRTDPQDVVEKTSHAEQQLDEPRQCLSFRESIGSVLLESGLSLLLAYSLVDGIHWILLNGSLKLFRKILDVHDVFLLKSNEKGGILPIL